MVADDGRECDGKQTVLDRPFEGGAGSYFAEQFRDSGREAMDAAFVNDDSSNEALVVDYDSPKCSPGEYTELK